VKAVGARLPRYDGVGHVTGRTQFVDDVRIGKTLVVKALRSPRAHAAITSFDTSKAEALNGVRAIVTHSDVPRNVYGHLEGLGVPADEPLLAEEDVRYKGQPIAAVAAETEEAALAAVEAIEISYEERPAHFDMRTGLDPEAAQIHQWGNVYPHYGPYDHRRVRKGDIDWAFDSADTIVEGVYRPQAIEQMPLETQVAIAVPEANGRLTIYSCTQAMYFSMGVVAAHLQVPLNRLKFVGGTVGGGFGGKVDTATDTICALLALKAR
jgi:CO/xanthine dehydrogenase Mo-binding subunit